MIRTSLAAVFAIAATAVIPVTARAAPLTEAQIAGHRICWDGHGTGVFARNHAYWHVGADGKRNFPGKWMLSDGTLMMIHDDHSVVSSSIEIGPGRSVTSTRDGWTGHIC